MKIYCYRCTNCETRFETDHVDAQYCYECNSIGFLVRNYRAESVTINRDNIRAVRSEK